MHWHAPARIKCASVVVRARRRPIYILTGKRMRGFQKFGQLIDTLDAGVAKRAAEAADSLARAGFDPKDQQAARLLAVTATSCPATAGYRRPAGGR